MAIYPRQAGKGSPSTMGARAVRELICHPGCSCRLRRGILRTHGPPCSGRSVV